MLVGVSVGNTPVGPVTDWGRSNAPAIAISATETATAPISRMARPQWEFLSSCASVVAGVWPEPALEAYATPSRSSARRAMLQAICSLPSRCRDTASNRAHWAMGEDANRQTRPWRASVT